MERDCSRASPISAAAEFCNEIDSLQTFKVTLLPGCLRSYQSPFWFWSCLDRIANAFGVSQPRLV